MFRYRMTESPNCNRCGEIETVDHLLFECNDSKKMWKTYNTVLKRKLSSRYEINGKKDIFNFEIGTIENILKVKLINELIQIERPKFWTESRTEKILEEMRKFDKYIGKKNYPNLEKYTKKWGHMSPITHEQ